MSDADKLRGVLQRAADSLFSRAPGLRGPFKVPKFEQFQRSEGMPTAHSEANAKRRALDGAIVIAFQCDGCMGEDHKYLWSGRVEWFTDDGQVHIKVHKRTDHRDSRDESLGFEHAVVIDGSLQQLAPGLFYYFR